MLLDLNSFFNQLDRSKNCDVVFVENICEGPEDLPQEVQNAIPEGTFMYVRRKMTMESIIKVVVTSNCGRIIWNRFVSMNISFIMNLE